MKIPKQYHQFNNEIALLIVSGSNAFDLFLAQNGKIEKLLSYREPIPHYFDREEFFTQSGPGKEGLIGSGSVYESKKNEIQKRLNKKLREEIFNIFARNVISTVYLISPSYYLSLVKKAIPKEQKGKIKLSISKNIEGKHETIVLKNVTESLNKYFGTKEAVNENTRKIIKREKAS